MGRRAHAHSDQGLPYLRTDRIDNITTIEI